MNRDVLSRTVKDVFSEGYVSVREDETLSRCLSLITDRSIGKKASALAVLDSKGRYCGVLTPRRVVRSRLDPSTTKAKTLMRAAPKVSLDNSLSKVAKLMLESETRKLPVYRGKNLLGFVTEEDIINGAVDGNWGNTKVEKTMTRNPFVVEEDASVGSILSLFRNQDISHCPVVSRGRLVGIMSVRDVIEHVFQPRRRQTKGESVGEKAKSLSTPVRGIMSSPVITVLPDNRLRYAAEKMSELDISSLVAASDGRPVGILTKRDFLESIAQMEKTEPKLTLHLSLKDLEINGNERTLILDDFQALSRKYEEALESGTLFVYMKTHGTNYKGKQLVHCRLQLRTKKGSFFSVSEGWNIGETFGRALDRLDRQILRSKELEYNRKFARAYLKRTRFPLTEL